MLRSAIMNPSRLPSPRLPRKNRGLPAILALAVLFMPLAPLARAVGDETEQEFHTFTDASGRTVKAILIDKNETHVMLKLENGKNAKFEVAKLSPEDQEYVKGFDPAKDLFLKKCSNLTVRELLELRGYESCDFRNEGNHIHVNGEMNGKKTRFLIDTGAGSSTIHIEAAKAAECEIGPMDQIIYGIAGQAPAAITKVKTIKLGESIINDQELLSADLFEDHPPNVPKAFDAIFGADFLTRLDAVIDYKEYRMFLKPDLSDAAQEKPNADGDLDFRLFKGDDGKVYRGNVKTKSSSAVTLTLTNGKELQLPLASLSDADEQYLSDWTPERDVFMRKCRSLVVQDLLELRKYQPFEYERRGNHIFVDGELNGEKMPFMIDTGAGTTLLDVDAAKRTKCDVGPMDQKIRGIGGEAPAAITRVKKIQMGRALIENRTLLSADLFLQQGENPDRSYGAIFGADFLRELSAVVNYRESRVFLRP